MKKIALTSIALMLIVLQAGTGDVRADDTSIYGSATVSVQPNVLIVFDTSGSMSTNDVPGAYYNSGTTYSGSRTTNAVYRKTCGWSCSYDLFASSVDSLNCPDIKDALLTNGRVTGAIMDSSGSYNCGGTSKELYLGNWLNYDATVTSTRTRIAVAKEAITNLINTTNNVRFGLMRFNDNQGGRIVKVVGSSKTDLVAAVDGLTADGYTPLAETLAEAGLYFAGKASWFNSGVTYTSPIQYRCQKNYIIIMTDGEPTQDDDSKLRTGAYINGDHIADYDSDGNSGKLDDVAKYLYDNDIRSDLGTSGSSFERQNIITYTIGFQTEQQLLFDTAANGGGKYYTANSASGLSAAFEEIISSIADVNAVFVSPVVPVSRMNRTYAGDRLYVGFFKPQQNGRWLGNIKKYGLNSSGEILDAFGNAATLSDGTIKDNARSYWSITNDGPNVLKGGV
ncbi:MAG: vWA domain-containing protein, partial [Planctomycetota bacterium]